MNKHELLETIDKYEARSRELNEMFMAEEDISKAKLYLEESKGLAKKIAEMKKSYDQLVAREKQNEKGKIKEIFDKVLGRR